MIGIICAGQIELSPFVKKYTKVFEETGTPYEIIHWDRSGEERSDGDGYITFTMPLSRFSSKIKKLIPFLKFSAFVSRTVRERKYDRLVILTTQTAVLMPGVLFGKYKNKYFFDYRDTSYEYFKPYSMLINKFADNSCGMCVSSPGFKEYIKTKTPVVTAHNFQDDSYSERVEHCSKSSGGKIVMGYIGVLREFDYLKKLVTDFGNDPRFEFRIHGGGDDLDRLREFSSSFENVKVYGAYREEEKRSIVESFDLICYNYPYSFVNYPAVANKLYDGLIMKKPLFANSRTFSGRLVAENGLGVSVSEDDEHITDKIYDWYSSFDQSAFDKNCEEFLNRVISDEKDYIAAIRNFAEKN